VGNQIERQAPYALEFRLRVSSLTAARFRKAAQKHPVGRRPESGIPESARTLRAAMLVNQSEQAADLRQIFIRQKELFLELSRLTVFRS